MTTKPPCLGSNPGAQEQAENDCHTCEHQNHCGLDAADERHYTPERIESLAAQLYIKDCQHTNQPWFYWPFLKSDRKEHYRQKAKEKIKELEFYLDACPP